MARLSQLTVIFTLRLDSVHELSNNKTASQKWILVDHNVQ